LASSQEGLDARAFGFDAFFFHAENAVGANLYLSRSAATA